MDGSSALCSRGQKEKPFAQGNNTEVHGFWRWCFHTTSLPCWGFAWEACTSEKSPLSLGLLSCYPGRALVGDKLLKWEGSGALPVCVECV